MSLNDRQSAYIKHRIAGMSGAAAARAAGYATKSASVAAARLEKVSAIRASIAAGKKARQSDAALLFETAQDYLQAVVAGTVVPDPVRVSAARALLAYERPRTRRPPPPERTPTREAEQTRLEADLERREAWAQTRAEVRALMGRKQ